MHSRHHSLAEAVSESAGGRVGVGVVGVPGDRGAKGRGCGGGGGGGEANYMISLFEVRSLLHNYANLNWVSA